MKNEGTHESERENTQRAHSMRPHAQSEDSQIATRHHQIPQEIPRREALDHTTAPGVAVDTLRRAHGSPLLVNPHDPQGGGIDAAALHEGDDVHVPVDAGAAVQVWVDAREQRGGEPRREHGLHEFVEEEGQDYLVDVVGEGGEGEGLGDRCTNGGEPGRWSGNGIEHVGDEVKTAL